jgi:phosphoribosylanthranilate isomerase
MRTRVKICGITRAEDGVAAALAGADAIGLVFYAASPRAVGVASARQIVAALPPFVSVVALFVDAEPDLVRRVLEQVHIDLLQFHGDESPEQCAAFQRPYVKALRMQAGTDVRAHAARYATAAGLLLDAYLPGMPGGTGQAFDWQWIPAGLDRPIILAGGLRPDNVAEAVRAAHPYAVDVSGGVEAAKGIKDPDKIAAFLRSVRDADQS